ncbi:MAG TPA: right-handed parallel beta-helix repeat-containing protein [Gemmatimonadales bacterium]|nr:right-handed parallel beta-helix repeat-containing protein [Gemmatimonadales bacterium]
MPVGMLACSASPPEAVPPVTHVGHYAAPGGTSAGDGSASRPWDLPTALAGGNGQVQPGDTIWVRGGTYPGTFTSALAGTAAAPIVVRRYPGERAILDGDGSSNTLKIDGAWTNFWGLEVQVSTLDRANPRMDVVYVRYTANVKLINLVVHDGGTGIYTEPGAPGVEIYGCIVYNNGWQAGPTDRGHGHAIYVKNDAGTKLVRDNVLFNQYGFGVHVYSDLGSGGLNNIDVEGNVSFDNGALALPGTSGAANLLVGGEEPVNNGTVLSNLTYHAPTMSASNVRIGYGTVLSGSVTVSGNYAVGGAPVLWVEYWSAANVTGDTLVGTGDIVTLTDTSLAGQHWSRNRYYRDPIAPAWLYLDTAYPFSAWQAVTGLAATDTAMAGIPLATRVVVRPNVYEAGRGTVVVYNWSTQASVPVDLSTILQTGDRYEVRSVQALFGAPLVSGTYAGGSVSIPMTPVPPPTPIGLPASPAPVTGPAFDVFLVTRAGS